MTPSIVSVNVGRPQTREWRGRQVVSAIHKEPVSGPILASGVNLAGDDQADRRIHGGFDKAVYAYATEDYEWWERQLGRLLGPAPFGENLTTVGLDLTRSAIGDRWRVGEATLEVAQPRDPCYKLAMRMGDAAFRAQFDAAGRPGVYLRILEPGLLAAGDAITVEPAEEPAIRISELIGDPTEELLRRIVADGRFPDGWLKGAARALERAGLARSRASQGS